VRYRLYGLLVESDEPIDELRGVGVEGRKYCPRRSEAWTTLRAQERANNAPSGGAIVCDTVLAPDGQCAPAIGKRELPE
jgi:hypothetical protein